jgi:tetratricopeptide (TPR) repeat protein
MAVIFILGFFLDFIEIAVVVVPIVAPILLADPSANITAVWLGVMIGLNIQTSFLTPPFGFALFYLRGVAPAVVKTIQIYKGVIAFICLQLLALGIVGFYPQLVNYLPNRMSLLSETSPPPRNPKLQYCLTDYVHETVNNDGGATLSMIADAKALDLSVLPEDLAEDLGKSFEDAEMAIKSLGSVFEAEEAVNDAAGTYRPVLNQVRDLEKEVRKIDREVASLKQRIERLRDPSQAEQRAKLEATRADLLAEQERIAGGIPADWEDTYKAFNELVKAETTARQTYWRTADGAYETAVEIQGALNASDAFNALEDELLSMGDVIASTAPEEAEGQVNDLAKTFGDVPGADDVEDALKDARKALRAKEPDPAKAEEAYAEAVAAFETQKVWRAEAVASLLPALQTYVDEMSETLGARQQQKLSRDQALFIASCTAGHRDLSLNF